MMAWQQKRFRDYWRHLSQSGKPGRPAIAKEVRDLIQDMWRSNPLWGSPQRRGPEQAMCVHTAGFEASSGVREPLRGHESPLV